MNKTSKKAKKPVPKKTGKVVTKDSRISCRTCGLELKVLNDCDCVSPCDVICCGEQMVALC